MASTGSLEIFIGLGIWILIFIVWLVRTYPARTKQVLGFNNINVPKFKWPKRKNKPDRSTKVKQTNYKDLVHKVESIGAKDRFNASDAATLVEAVIKLNEIEPASGQIWEAYALDTLERASIVCDDCGTEVEKIVRKTGVRIQCSRCGKWLALRNSKVTVIDPNRPDLEEWETQTRH